MHERTAKSQNLNHINHIIIYLNGDLHLWKRDAKDNFIELCVCKSAAMDFPYKLLKTMAHIAVTVNVLAQTHDASLMMKLQEQLHDMLNSDNPLLQIHMNFIKRTLDLLENFSDDQIVAYNNAIKLVLDEYSKNAAELQLESLAHIMHIWTEEYRIDPATSRALIVSAHGPRVDLLERQYFDYWNNNKGFVYTVEMLPTQMATINISRDLIDGFLNKHELNKTLGKTLLDDENAMFRDVLGKHAHNKINQASSKIQGCPFHK